MVNSLESLLYDPILFHNLIIEDWSYPLINWIINASFQNLKIHHYLHMPMFNSLTKWMGEMFLWWLMHVWIMLKLANVSKIGPKFVHSTKCTKSALWKQSAAGCVHEIITSCSSKLLRWGWCLLKAEIALFNFDVHPFHWFILEISENCPWSGAKKSVKTLRNFSKC